MAHEAGTAAEAAALMCRIAEQYPLHFVGLSSIELRDQLMALACQPPSLRSSLDASACFITAPPQSYEAHLKAFVGEIDEAALYDDVATAERRDTLAAMAKYATTPRSVVSVSIMLAIAVPPSFTTASVRDVLLDMSLYATTPRAVRWLASAMANLIVEVGGTRPMPSCKKLFATAPVRDSLTLMSRYATTYDSINAVCVVMCILASRDEEEEERQQEDEGTEERSENRTPSCSTSLVAAAPAILLFRTSEVCDALTTMAKYATTIEAVIDVCTVIAEILRGAPIRDVDTFATPAMHDALVAMAGHATTDMAAVVRLSSLLAGISAFTIKSGTAAVRDALVTMCRSWNPEA